MVSVWVASTSTFSGNETMRSTNERAVSKPRARSRERAESSGISVVNNRVTSITGASSLPKASTPNAITIGDVLAASTARAIGCLGSATTS